MLTFCLIALGVTAVMLVSVLAEAVHRAARPPVWQAASRRLLAEAANAERRTRFLPFVGTERRHQSVQMALDLAEVRRAA